MSIQYVDTVHVYILGVSGAPWTPHFYIDFGVRLEFVRLELSMGPGEWKQGTHNIQHSPNAETCHGHLEMSALQHLHL